MTNKRRDKRKAFTRDTALKWLQRDWNEPDYESRPSMTSRSRIGWAFTFSPKEQRTETGQILFAETFIVDDRDGVIHRVGKKGIRWYVARLLDDE